MSHPMVSCSVVFTASEAVVPLIPLPVAAIICSKVWPTGVTLAARGPSKRIYRAWVTKCRGPLERSGIEHKILEPDRPVRVGEAMNDGVFESKALWVIPADLRASEDILKLLSRIHAAPEIEDLLVAPRGTPAFRWNLWAQEALKEVDPESWKDAAPVFGARRSGTGGFAVFAQDPVADFVQLLEGGGVKREDVE